MVGKDISVKYERRVKVLLPLPFNQSFDYEADGDLVPGTVVKVPFGKREILGVVWEGERDGQLTKVKSIIRVLDLPPFKPSFVNFMKWVADYTMMPLGIVLRMAMPIQDDSFMSNAEIPLYTLGAVPKRLTPAREKLIAYLREKEVGTIKQIAGDTGISLATAKKLISQGILERKGSTQQEKRFKRPEYQRDKIIFSGDQQHAVGHLVQKVESNSFNVTLLDGVTGSGKTEVYFAAIAKAIEKGEQALVLLPEIALSAQWIKRFEACFNTKPAVWHSEQAKGQRKEIWVGVLKGDIQVVVGARSALFLPFPRLGLIIIDEEHDTSYKQEEGGFYHARDMAIVRAQQEKIPCVLVSATPSLETIYNCQKGKFGLLPLKQRYASATMPDITLIDMRAFSMQGQWISKPMREKLEETLKKGEQSMLFLNRRGYAPLVICASCGERINCRQCSVSLVYHKHAHQLLCHHCGFTARLPEKCLSCEKEGTYIRYGPGVEKVIEEVESFLPGARCALMTSDALSTPRKIEDLVRKVQDHQVDILVGTQIMAKGHHFPLLTFVGVVDADASLSGSDLRGAEKTYQLLHQLAGRSGRERREGQVYLQTYMPNNQVMQALKSYDRDRFFMIESQQRMLQGLPPYGRLVAIIVSSQKREEAENYSKRLSRSFPIAEKIQLLGPTPAPLAYLRGRYRWRMLVKTTREFPVQSFIQYWLENTKAPSSVRVQIDIDPYSFL